jgi:ATP-dependent RNA helicase HelY
LAEKFTPDPFQREAIAALDDGASVLVAAPTGSGKTYVAEHAIMRALSNGGRAFYTAPIKALSNQKFRDFQQLYGTERVGLLTGDSSINPSAPVLVMTTEVLRNMIYADSPALDDLRVVVLDEVHFLQDQYRGPVWEEVIIHLPLEVALVCLSATVSNAQEVADWLTTVRGDTRAVVETKRPVTLEHHHAFYDKATGQTSVVPTLEGTKANPRLKRILSTDNSSKGVRGGQRQAKRRDTRVAPPTRSEVVEELQHRDMLPAIYFIFSRNQCDEAARGCRRSALSFVTAHEAEEIRRIANSHAENLSTEERRALDYDGFVSLISTGAAPHHAGMVPAFKETVEEAFALGLIKVVFATETLAVGINMPARTVVIDKLTRFTGERHVPLKPSDFTQLTGRAGRRGIDPIGHAVTLWSPFVGLDEVVRFATNKTFHLTSAFRPTYNMTVNLVRTHAEAEVRHLLNLSFAQFQANANVVDVQARIERRRDALASAETRAESAYGDIWRYRARHGLGQFRAAAVSPARHSADRDLWDTLRPGDVIGADTGGTKEKLLVIATAARKRGLKITVVDVRQGVRGLVMDQLVSTPVLLGRLALPEDFSQWNPSHMKVVAQQLQHFRGTASQPQRETFDDEYDSEEGERDSVDRVEDDPALRERLRHADTADRIRGEILRLERQLSEESQTVSATFDLVLRVLRDEAFIEGWSLTPKGALLAGIFHECDILVAECLHHGLFDTLSAADLAAVVSCVVYERRGTDDIEVSFPSETAERAIERLEDMSLEIQDRELAAGLPVHRFPDPAFARAAALWASGASLTKVLDVLPEMSAGDFVRTVRQIVDLLRQIERVSTVAHLRNAAGKAAEGMFRGIVIGSEIIG